MHARSEQNSLFEIAFFSSSQKKLNACLHACTLCATTQAGSLMGQTNCVMQLRGGNDSAKNGLGQVYTLYCTSYWNKNVWSDGQTQSYCTTFFCQEFCQAEVHKDTAFPHVPFNNLKVFWLERCPLAPVTMQNNCLMFHIQLCKAIRGIRWHEILRRQENNSNCRIALEGNCCFLIV